MTALAVLLVVSSAVMHAGWNLLAKRVGGGAVFVGMFSALSVLLITPFALGYALLADPVITPAGWGYIAASGVIHIVYYLMLQNAYRVGDLSLIYPVARSTSPIVATVVAVAVLGERPSTTALAGAVLIVGGLLVLTRGPAQVAGGKRAIVFAVITGSLSAAYSLCDKYAVSVVLVPPLLLDYFATLLVALLSAPFVFSRRREARAIWKEHGKRVLGTALLRPASYILVLLALVFTPLSYVAPFREISILFGVLMGAALLREGHVRRRLGAALAMTLGAVALATG